MAIDYISVEEAIARPGLRIVLVQGMPSPWGQAAKAMMEYKGLEFVCAPQEAGGANAALVAWAGVNSGPVVAWNDEPPINRWDDILFLLERLGPHKPLVPEARAARVQVLGLAHEICGELGLGWNTRLAIFRPIVESGQAPDGVQSMSAKYGYRETDVALAAERVKATLALLAEILAAQRARGHDYLVGEGLSAVDFYWAAFCNLIDLPGDDVVPVAAPTRAMFDQMRDACGAALAPELKAHRDRIMQAHFKIPMEM